MNLQDYNDEYEYHESMIGQDAPEPDPDKLYDAHIERQMANEKYLADARIEMEMARQQGIQEKRYIVVKLSEPFNVEKEKSKLIDDLLNSHGDQLKRMYGENNEDTIMEAVIGTVERAFNRACAEFELDIKL